MRTAPRRIRTKLEAGGFAYGATIQLPSPESVEIAGYVGYDFAWIDAEHGTMGIAEINHLIRAADAGGLDAIVRVPDHDASFIQRVLDIGATGIMVPHMRTVEEAERIVAAAKYAPSGIRGACPAVRSVGHLTEDWFADSTRADADVLLFGLIEDIEGVENVEAIARSGLDGLLFGPFDLSMALGLHGDIAAPQVQQMQAQVLQAALDAGIQYVALAGWEPQPLPELAARGVRMFNITGDRGLLHVEFSRGLREAGAALESVLAAGSRA
jgi:2-keto-3-deoxy-L-rhamnonate aldolase RhmA